MAVGLIGIRFLLTAGGVWKLQKWLLCAVDGLAVWMGRIAIPCSPLFTGLVL